MARADCFRHRMGTAVPVLLVLAAAGCAGPARGPDIDDTVRTGYAEARAAFESGRYDEAARRYRAMLAMGQTRSFAGALRIERAHALLRTGDYAGALAEAETALVAAVSDEDAHHAQIVIGVAGHEAAKAAAAVDGGGGETEGLLRDAYETLRATSASSPEPETIRLLTQRMREIRRELAMIELGRLSADLDRRDHETAARRAAYIEQEFSDVAVLEAARPLLSKARSDGSGSAGWDAGSVAPGSSEHPER